MRVSHFGGAIECGTIEELVNEFLLSGDKRFPCLAIMVNNEYAVLTFFPENEDCLFQSIGEGTALNPDETSIFYTGTQDQETQIWNEFVIPFAKAREAATEFFASLSLPVCIEWSKQ